MGKSAYDRMFQYARGQGEGRFEGHPHRSTPGSPEERELPPCRDGGQGVSLGAAACGPTNARKSDFPAPCLRGGRTGTHRRPRLASRNVVPIWQVPRRRAPRMVGISSGNYVTSATAQWANDSHASVPDIASRSGCEIRITSPPQTVARWIRPIVSRSKPMSGST